MSNNNNLTINGTMNVAGQTARSGNLVVAPLGTNFTTDSLFQVFTQSNVVIILWFLAVYFVVYILLSIFRGSDAVKPSISRWIDIVSLICVLAYLSITFFAKTDADKSKMVSDLFKSFESYLNTPLSLISVGFFILTLYIVIYILELPMDYVGKPITISIIENGAWLFFVIILIAVFLKYIVGLSLSRFLDDAGDFLQNKANQANPPPEKKGNTEPKPAAPVSKDEVFNVGNNMYTYDDAQSVCASFGARLATYDDIESAYDDGAEWCNYGWSEGQAAYFPTQKDTWKKLQKSDSTKNSCGRPGINGGFIDNPDVRFGVNCFGKKPKPKASDLAAMANGQQIPKSPEDILLEKKIQFWKDNGNKLFQINGYNNKKWSMY